MPRGTKALDAADLAVEAPQVYGGGGQPGAALHSRALRTLGGRGGPFLHQHCIETRGEIGAASSRLRGEADCHRPGGHGAPSKPRGDVFLDRIAERLDARGIEVRRYRKPTVARPAPLEIQQAIAEECDVMIEGLAD